MRSSTRAETSATQDDGAPRVRRRLRRLGDEMHAHVEALERRRAGEIRPVQRPVVVEQHHDAVAHVPRERREQVEQPDAAARRERDDRDVEHGVVGLRSSTMPEHRAEARVGRRRRWRRSRRSMPARRLERRERLGLARAAAAVSSPVAAPTSSTLAVVGDLVEQRGDELAGRCAPGRSRSRSGSAKRSRSRERRLDGHAELGRDQRRGFSPAFDHRRAVLQTRSVRADAGCPPARAASP